MKTSYQQELVAALQKIQVHEAMALPEGMRQHAPLFDKLGKLYVFYRYLVERGVTNQAPWGVQILYAKISNCLLSTQVLLQSGYAGTAAMVFRSLFEANIHLELILERDVPERAKLFVDFQHIEFGTTYSAANQSKQVQKVHKMAYEEVKAAYRPLDPHSWCWQLVKSKRIGRGGFPNDPSLKDLCRYLGREKDYDRVYGKVSASVHPVPSYGLFIKRKGEGCTLELGPHFSEMTNAMGEFTLIFGVKSILALIEFLNLPDGIQLSFYIRREMHMLLPEERQLLRKM